MCLPLHFGYRPHTQFENTSDHEERECVCVLWGRVVIVGKSIVHSRGEVERETNHPDQTLDIDAETMLA